MESAVDEGANTVHAPECSWFHLRPGEITYGHNPVADRGDALVNLHRLDSVVMIGSQGEYNDNINSSRLDHKYSCTLA